MTRAPSIVHRPTEVLPAAHLAAMPRRPRTEVPERRTITVIATTLMLVLTVVTGAQAAPAGYEEQPHVDGLFYANFDQDVLLFAGATAQEFCNDNEPTHDARVFHRSDGTVDIKVNVSKQPIYLYASPLGAPELIDATCKAMSDDDPGTVPLEPFAVGDGRVRMRIKIAPDDGTVHVVNSTVGSASSADGTTWKVRGWADLMVVDGVPAGDPSEFQGLRATPTGA